jgi:hypothetical protein
MFLTAPPKEGMEEFTPPASSPDEVVADSSGREVGSVDSQEGSS